MAYFRCAEACGVEAKNTFALAVGCTLTLQVSDNQIVGVTSSLEQEVGHGHATLYT
jgi:hypothetical protein